MQTIQKVVLGCAVAITIAAPMAANAAVTTVDNTTTVTPATVSSGDLSGFVKNQFVFTGSAGVKLIANGDATATAIAVSAANKKGTSVFGGSSNGGGAIKCEAIVIPAGTDPTLKIPSAPDTTKNGCV